MFTLNELYVSRARDTWAGACSIHITTCLTAYTYWKTRSRVPNSSCTCPWHRVTYNFEPRAFLFLLNPFLTLSPLSLSLSLSLFYIYSLILVPGHTYKLAEIGWTKWVSSRPTCWAQKNQKSCLDTDKDENKMII